MRVLRLGSVQVFGWGTAPNHPRDVKGIPILRRENVYQGHASPNLRAMRLRPIHQINANAEITKVLKTFVISASKHYL